MELSESPLGGCLPVRDPAFSGVSASPLALPVCARAGLFLAEREGSGPKHEVQLPDEPTAGESSHQVGVAVHRLISRHRSPFLSRNTVYRLGKDGVHVA